MTKRDLLLEIGLEEMPARMIVGAAAQLKEKIEKWFQAERISYGAIQAFETPRRLAVLVQGVAEKQADRNEEAKGPARKIALDDSGNWSKAAQGFARSNGVEPEQLYFKEFNGVEYVYARKNEIGKETAILLPAVKDVITSMTFPKNMRWGANELKYVRPIRWFVALFGDTLLDMEISGVAAGRVTRGHRFLGQETELVAPSDYVAKLEDQFVLVDPSERERIIVHQIKQLEAQKGWKIPIDEDLLEEVVHLVEYPTALFGTFNPEFLHIPREVLVTSMREHQRYFPVENESGELLPYFVTVRNGNTRSIENVAKGNEKVLRARLSDARFFYEEDQKLKIEDCLKRLETIVFHEELGTIGDKVRRIQKNAAQIANLVGSSDTTKANAARIASIAKFDLVTNMVYEFPELQGIMGEDYARKAGESEAVARGIFEHYLPRFAGDKLPVLEEGALVGIADKVDTIVGCFCIGIIPTGSQDPYGLRRQAAGIVSIILERGWKVPLSALFEAALTTYAEQGVAKRSADEIRKDLTDFFALRIKNVLQDEQIRYDISDAVLATDITSVRTTIEKAKALMEIVKTDDFKLTVEQFNRVYNLAQKASSVEVNSAFLEEEVEQKLYQAYLSISKECQDLYAQEQVATVLQTLATLREPIQAFFDKVMVMAEDENIRHNRLALLAALSKEIQGFADFTKLVFA